jgi:trk system potassium uptake protein TrkA
MLIIAILRGESLIIPKGDTQILADDDILAITNDDGREKLEEAFN